jgi:sugar/nucleoside kinase (ribokinase family)
MVDIIAVLDTDSIEQISFSNAHEQFLLVEPGRKVEARSISTHIGGGGLNTAVCLARLGCDVAPLVKTGNDSSRAHVLQHCREQGLDSRLVLTDETDSTGSAVMIASHDKNAAIFTHRGSNTRLIDNDLDQASPLEADLIHAAPLSGDSAKLLPLIAERAKQSGAFFSSNPGIRQITTKASSVLTAARYMSLMAINAVEAAALVPCLSAIKGDIDWGTPNKDEPVLKLQGTTIGLRRFCEIVHDDGPDNILVTYGGEGAWMFDGNDLHFQAVIPAEVAGTAGAGDSFVSTLAWALQSGRPAGEAMALAAQNASSVVSFVNTTDGLLASDELLARAGFSN